MSVQGIHIYTRYVNDSTLNSVQSIKFVNNVSNSYFLVIFDTQILTIGKFFLNSPTMHTILYDNNSGGSLLGPDSMVNQQ